MKDDGKRLRAEMFYAVVPLLCYSMLYAVAHTVVDCSILKDWRAPKFIFKHIKSVNYIDLAFSENTYSGRELDRMEALAQMLSDLWGRATRSLPVLYQSPTGLWRSKLHWRKARNS